MTSAAQEKALGNAAYRRRDFEVALCHYAKAQSLDPYDIVYRTNRAAVYFEQGLFQCCIRECEGAVELGHQVHADFKQIAKALARIGSAYWRLEDLPNALAYYNKSLAEYRDPDVLQKAQEVDKIIKERERIAYINPELALQQKQIGNDLFVQGLYPEALTHYTEAIKRNPTDALLYSNRAACYAKLLEFGLAVRDCDECLRLQPTFVKGYLRKGSCLTALKEYTLAAEAYQQAIHLDPGCEEAVEGFRISVMKEYSDPEAVRRRAMTDPEIQSILEDQAMKHILQQMQTDPQALQEHLKNPEVARKIEKLIGAGLISVR